MNTSFDEAFTDWLFCERVHINQVLHYWFACGNTVFVVWKTALRYKLSLCLF